MAKRIALALAIVVSLPLFGLSAGKAASEEVGEALVQDLQKGGYILFFRHAKTDPTRADTDTLHLENCAAQRELTVLGKEQASTMGEALRELKIPVGQVISSQYCRALETARLAGFEEIETTLDVSEGQNVPPVEQMRRADALRKLLSAQPKSGTNTVIISHKPNLLDATGAEFFDVAEGEVIVFKPIQDKPGYKVIARVAKPESWTQSTQSK